MQLFIYFLGTGGSWPTVQRNVSATAIKRGGEIILFDCGEGTQRQFQKSKLSYMQISKIFITHYHGDHFLGLPGFIQTLQLNDRQRPLHIYGPEGTEKIVDEIIHLGYFKPSYEIIAHDLKAGEKIKFGGYSIETAKACHNVFSLAYSLKESKRPGKFNKEKAIELGIPEGPMFRRLQHGESIEINGKIIAPSMVLGEPRAGRKITISGDTTPCNNIIKLAYGSDVLIHEATFDSNLKDISMEYGHTTASQAAEIAKKANVEKLFLTHISPRYFNAKELEEEAQKIFKNSFVPKDFQEIEIRLKK